MGFTSNWHDAAILDYESTELSRLEIATKYGRSLGTISKLLRGIKPKVAKRQNNKRWTELDPLSPMHKDIGNLLGYYRNIKRGWSVNDLSQELHRSWQVVRKMELGQHDFTLVELGVIARLLEVPLGQLINTSAPNLKALHAR